MHNAFNQLTPSGRHQPFCPISIVPGILTVLILVHIATANSAQYTVAGKINVHKISRESAAVGKLKHVEPSEEYAFVVTVAGCRWSVRITPEVLPPAALDSPPPGTQPLPTDWTEVALSDGKEFCFYRKRAQPDPKIASEAIRGPGSAPFRATRPVIVAWYTFASQCELRDTTNGFFVPFRPMSAKSLRGATRIPAKFALLPGIPHLPERIVSYGCVSQSDGAMEIVPSADWATNAVLQVNLITNIHGLTIPLEASVRYYDVHRSSAGIRSSPGVVFIQVQTMSVLPEAQVDNYPPGLAGKYVISDYRYMENSPDGVVTMVITNGWPQDTVAKASAQSRIRSRKPIGWSSSKKVWLAIMAAVVAVPPLFALWRSCDGSSKKPKHT